MAFGLYLHIPYCFSRCRYCDFYARPGVRGVPEEYVDALLRELRRFAPGRPETVYFGGGTPSLLSPAQAARLIQGEGDIPVLTLPYTKQQLGQALGQGECAAMAVTDTGFARSLCEKLGQARLAEQMQARLIREKRRRQKKILRKSQVNRGK